MDDTTGERESTYSFTPKRVLKSKAHHAWERKPVTATAGPHENKKIWKRYDFPGCESQKTEIRRRTSPLSNIRSIKRVKMSNGEVGDNACGTKWDEGVDGGHRHKRISRRFEVYEEPAESTSQKQDSEPEFVFEIQRIDTDALMDIATNISLQPSHEPSVTDTEVVEKPVNQTPQIQTSPRSPKKNPLEASPGSVGLNPLQAPKISPPDDDAALFEALQSFISRAKAKKAETTASEKSPELSNTSQLLSPMTRSRAALLSSNDDAAIPSPKSPTPQTPATKAPVRRSTRTPARKANKSTKTETTKTTTHEIPVLRRSNGTEFVFLARNEAQEVALATKNNTRKNKGGAMEPKLRLKEAIEMRTPSPRKRIVTKTVAWDETLAYFQSEKKKKIEEEEGEGKKTKKKSQRAKRLTNGTPVSRKLLADPVDPPTPTGKRSGSTGRRK